VQCIFKKGSFVIALYIMYVVVSFSVPTRDSHTRSMNGSTKYIYAFIEYHSVCTLVGIGTTPPPTPSPTSDCVPPPGTKGGAHTLAGEGMGESQFERLEKKPSTLSTL
jgi:hypothetical protein